MAPLAQVVRHTEARSAWRPASERLRVLTVGRSMRLSLAIRMLRTGGLAVHLEQVRRAADLLPRLRADRVDLVLLDLDQAGPGGLEGLHDLCAMAPQVPLVVLADLQDEPEAIEALRAGAQDYLIGEHLTPSSAVRAVRCALERHRHLALLRDLSLRDPLTGLYNRRGFGAVAEAQLRMARREGRRCLVVCADLDQLKAVNDTWGHDAGDRALVAAAQVFHGSFRDSDIVARFGGDEFVALAYHAGADAVAALTRRIESGLAQAAHALRLPHPLRLSLGAVAFDEPDPAALPRLIAQADRLLYQRKQARRNRAAPAVPPPGR
jgi:diguanylate cyclase (GGDEF)-like protein